MFETIVWATDGSALADSALDQLQRADDATGALARRGCNADQRDHLLRLHPRHRRLALDRVARGHLDLRAERVLASDDGSGDVLCELLDQDGLADHELVDRLLEQLREARHVYAALGGIEVDRAGDLGEDELLVPATAEADRLVDAAHARAREANPDLGLGRLEIRC